MNFDDKAKSWDDDPQKSERNENIAEAIIRNLNGRSEMKALEFGAGTGALSFLLKDYCQSVTLIDSSNGMLEVLNEKIKRNSVDNFIPLNMDLLNAKLDDNFKFDLIYTAMTMHHVEDLEGIIAKFSEILNIGGQLFIADLCPEDGNFHLGINAGNYHKGIDIESLIPIFNKYSIKQTDYKVIYKTKRNINGKIVDYPIFLFSAEKE